MKTSLAVLILTSLLLLGSCRNEVTHTIEYVPYKNGKEGTVDGGGGNGINGIPLESYIIDPQPLIQSNSILADALKALSQAFLPLAGDLLHVTRERSWYMVPVALDQIPSVLIGVNFPTDQIALQNRREIWFDSKLFDAMSDNDKAHILLHEMVMGVRFLEFEDSLDLCLANASQDLLPSAPEHTYDDKRRKCFDLYGIGSQVGGLFNPGATIQISEVDYANIRYLTNLLLTQASNLDGKEIADWLKITKFRSY